MKQCCRCKEHKPLTDFNKKSANPDGLERYCKICHRAKNKKHYEANKAKYVEQSMRYRKQYVEWYKNLKLELKCERCGEDYFSKTNQRRFVVYCWHRRNNGDRKSVV